MRLFYQPLLSDSEFEDRNYNRAFRSADGGDVPLDGSRGSYEGAENIHWYMQDTLRTTTFEEGGDTPLIGEPFQCNQADETRDCYGYQIWKPQPVYQQPARTWIKVAILVDSRIDYSYRFALKQIRDTNRIFDRSGIRVRLFVSDIRAVSMVEQFNDDPENAWEYLANNRIELSRYNGADILIVMFRESYNYPVSYCGVGSLGYEPDIQGAVITCNYDEFVVAHEIGHNLGLTHNAEDSSHQSFVENGYGFIEPNTVAGTVMSYAASYIGGKRYPLFSSPGSVSTVDGYGQLIFGSQAANAVSAANSAAVMIGYANEVTHGLISTSHYELVVTEGGNLVQTNIGSNAALEKMKNWVLLNPSTGLVKVED